MGEDGVIFSNKGNRYNYWIDYYGNLFDYRHCVDDMGEQEEMSMISEQINTLRELAELQNIPYHKRIIKRAADTIEALSAKLADMERSAEDCDGWITDRVPTREECGDFGKEFAVTVDANGIKTLVMKYVYETVRGKEVSRWKWIGRISTWKVIAWKPLPEPYRGH